MRPSCIIHNHRLCECPVKCKHYNLSNLMGFRWAAAGGGAVKPAGGWWKLSGESPQTPWRSRWWRGKLCVTQQWVWRTDSRNETLTVPAKWSPHAVAVHLTQDGTWWETSDAQWRLNISAADGAISCFFDRIDRQIETAASLSHTLPLPAWIPSRPALFINPPSSSLPLPLSVKHIAQRKQSWDLHAWPCWLICIPDEKKKEIMCFLFLLSAFSWLFLLQFTDRVNFSEEMLEYDWQEIY